MTSVRGLLEEREMVARARAAELRAEAERVLAELSETEGVLERREIARTGLVEALAAPTAVTDVPVDEPRQVAVTVSAGAKTVPVAGSIVPRWRQGVAAEALAAAALCPNGRPRSRTGAGGNRATTHGSWTEEGPSRKTGTTGPPRCSCVATPSCQGALRSSSCVCSVKITRPGILVDQNQARPQARAVDWCVADLHPGLARRIWLDEVGKASNRTSRQARRTGGRMTARHGAMITSYHSISRMRSATTARPSSPPAPVFSGLGT